MASARFLLALQSSVEVTEPGGFTLDLFQQSCH
jgi:hypothetical protein